MKSLKNKKGFTIVELVIVIAVIAILAAVLIPTFSGIIERANKSAVQQVAASLYKEAYALDLSDGVLDGKEGEAAITEVEKNEVEYKVDEKTHTFTSFSYTDSEKGYTATFDGETWTIKEASASTEIDADKGGNDKGTAQ